MVVHEIAGAPDMIDVLLWDAAEREWRIGHQRELYVGQAFWCACTMAEAEDLITDGEPVPVFQRVTHWAPLPPKVQP